MSIYTDRPAFKAHLALPYFLAFDAATRDMVISKTISEFGSPRLRRPDGYRRRRLHGRLAILIDYDDVVGEDGHAAQPIGSCQLATVRPATDGDAAAPVATAC